MALAPGAAIRPRQPEDVPALVAVLAEQQPTSHYPFRWPLPFPAEEFVARSGELAAWTGTLDGSIAGHVCTQTPEGSAGTNAVDESDLVRAWSTAHQRPASELVVISSLFTSLAARGTGLGGALLDTAVAWARERDLAPCLDVVQGPSPAAEIYRAKGWSVAGTVRPPWLPDDLPDVLAMVLR